MGSILMHLCISDQLRKKYNFGSKFMVGSVLPDIYKRTIMSRDESHYIEKTVEDGYSYHLPNLDRFVEEHKEKITTDDITIGYYAHLVEDYVWFKYVSGLFTKVKEDEDAQDLVRYRSENYEIPHPEKEYSEAMYQDYSNMNEWLYKKYPIDIEEIAFMTREYTNDEQAYSIIKEYCCTNKIYRDGKNVFLTEENIERYIKASIELFELEWEKVKNKYNQL